MSGYSIYHMPSIDSRNVLNYVMRYEIRTNMNFNSQQFINTFRITNNLWVQYTEYSNEVWIFDDRAWNARIVVDPMVYVTANNRNGNFTHYSVSSITHGSWASNFVSAAIEWVPYLSTIASNWETISSGTKVKTGSTHPTNKLVKTLEIEQKDLIRPGDHITLTGIGKNVDNINYGFSYSCFAK